MLGHFNDITLVVTAIASLAAVMVSLFNSKQISKIEQTTTSLMERLVALTAKSSRAEGVKEEKDRHDKEGG